MLPLAGALSPRMDPRRRPIWQADPALRDAVIVLSFDPTALETLARRAGATLHQLTPWRTVDVFLGVGGACAADTPLAGAVAHRLDALHATALSALARPGGLDALRAELGRARDLRDLPDIAGHLWALATSTDPAAERLCSAVGSLVSVSALRRLVERPG